MRTIVCHGDSLTEGSDLEKYYLEDGLHPDKSGHLLMAEKMVDLLRSLFYFP